MRKMTILISAGTGYVLGARAGRERYEQICSVWGKVRSNRQVQQAAGTIAHKGNDMAHAVAGKAADKAPDWMPGSRSDAETTVGTTGTVNGQTGMPAGRAF
jgi:hypothetical protein